MLSSSTWVIPSCSEIRRARVVFPEPAVPTTEIRRIACMTGLSTELADTIAAIAISVPG